MAALINGGYRVQNIHKFDPKYKCSVCHNLFRNPVQLDCGHRICHTCFNPQNNIVQCLECDTETNTSEIKPDKGFQRDMQTLEVICNLCSWSGLLKSYENHLEQAHRQFKCEYCDEIFNSLPLIEEHKEKLCSKTPMHCVLQRYGCKDQFLRGDLEDHFRSQVHQEAVVCCVVQIYKQFTEPCHTSAIAPTNMEMETSDLSYKVTTTATTTEMTEKHSDDLNNLHSVLDILATGTRTLNEDLIRVNSESEQSSQSLEATEKLLSTTKTSIEELNNVLTAVHTNISILQQDLSVLRQKYEEQQFISYDGTLLWKITGFRDKMTDAKSERQVSIYSPPFCSSPTGYTMKARLYLFGDGNARRTHMSLFFVLLRSPHDSLLQFPFSYKVTFCLFDQTAQRRHIIDSFRPDIKSNSFQRPRSNMNIASGIPKFAPLSLFEGPDSLYVKDDTMFIRIMVDFENMPKAVLPYALALNPGLSAHAQQKLIREEVERKAPQSQSTTLVNVTSSNTKKN